MLIILAALIGICSADVSHLQGSAYLPPYVSNGASGAYQGGYSSRSQDANAHILRQSNDVNDRSFAYDFETSNGIKAHQNGQATNGVQSQGAFSYKGDDGHDYSITYTADENGYRPQGAHLPTPPPVPEAILRSLQYIRANPSASDNSGSYRASQFGSGQYSPPRQTGFNTQTGYHY